MNTNVTISPVALPGACARASTPGHRLVCPKVFVLSDSRLFRDGVAALLTREAGLQVTGTAALSAPPRSYDADILLLDIADRHALDQFGLLHSANASAKVVALGVVDDAALVLACARLGVSGFVAPGGSAADVVKAVQSAVRGELLCSPRTAGMLLSFASRQDDGSAPHPDALTEREGEIILLIEQGQSNKDIALTLGIASATVKNHVHNILCKLRVRNRQQAAARHRKSLAIWTGAPSGQPEDIARRQSRVPVTVSGAG